MQTFCAFSQFRGPSPENQSSTSSCRIQPKDLKKVKVVIYRNLNIDPDVATTEIDRSLKPEDMTLVRKRGKFCNPEMIGTNCKFEQNLHSI